MSDVHHSGEGEKKGGEPMSPGFRKFLIAVAVILLIIYFAPFIIKGSVCLGACDKAVSGRLNGVGKQGTMRRFSLPAQTDDGWKTHQPGMSPPGSYPCTKMVNGVQ